MIRALARALGVDPRTFGVLHRAFWTLSRRAASGLVQGKAAGKERGVSTGMWIYALLGTFAAVAGFAVTHGGPRDPYGTIVLGMTLVLVGLGVVADFAAVVVAPGDDEILFHLPLSSRTYLAARLTVAARHTALLSFFYALAPAVVGAIAWRNALYAPLLLLAAVWTGLFALLLSFLVYRVALKLLGGERLRTLLAYVPGVLSLFMMLAPQFLPSGQVREAGREAVGSVLDRIGWALPPAWFSAMAEATLGAHDAGTLLRAVIGLLVVPFGAVVLVVALGRGFLDDLQRLVSAKDGGRPSRAPAAPRPLPPGRLARAIFPLSTPEARAGWLLYVGAMRSRASRARIFPMLVIPFVFVLAGLVRRGQSPMSSMALYLAAAAGGSMVSFLPYHEHKDGAWLLEAAPLRRYGALYAGMLWALLGCYVLPTTLALAALVSALDPSLATIGGALHATSGALLSTAVVAAMSKPEVPFSRAFQAGEQGKRTWIVFVNMLLLGVLGGIHAAVAAVAPWAFLLTAPAVVVVSALWLRATAARLDAFPPAELRPAVG